jgi:hypothetical protein
MDEHEILAKAIRLFVEQSRGLDLEISLPVSEVRPQLAGVVDGMINPNAAFSWLDDDSAFAKVAADPSFRRAMSDQGLALSVGKLRDVLFVNISTISDSEAPLD